MQWWQSIKLSRSSAGISGSEGRLRDVKCASFGSGWSFAFQLLQKAADI